ncbi:MAG: GlsB/YeaQ/YmgE family stress response membrane protein [Chthoniobacter sp.]
MHHPHHLIGTLIIGLLIGIVAKLLMPGRDPGGCIITMLLGIAGAAFGTYLGQLMGFYTYGQNAGFFGSVIGAMLILLLYRMILGRRP